MSPAVLRGIHFRNQQIKRLQRKAVPPWSCRNLQVGNLSLRKSQRGRLPWPRSRSTACLQMVNWLCRKSDLRKHVSRTIRFSVRLLIMPLLIMDWRWQPIFQNSGPMRNIITVRRSEFDHGMRICFVILDTHICCRIVMQKQLVI